MARSWTAFARGPSPRARGSLVVRDEGVAGLGSIPACAGKPRSRCRRGRRSRVHPRVRGEAPFGTAPWTASQGPSPRARGSHGDGGGSVSHGGSIPACAGKPASGSRIRGGPRVHPRVRGEAQLDDGRLVYHYGPSPRARGSPPPPSDQLAPHGSIPACAGKPGGYISPESRNWVHPRVRGEACHVVGMNWPHPGPSPRARGSPNREGPYALAPRSIPACAGKPPGRPGPGGRARVHPRVRGEASVKTLTNLRLFSCQRAAAC